MGYMKELDRRIRQGGDDAIAAVGELLPRWIPVSERLPPPPPHQWEDTTPVLGWSKHNGRGIAYFIRDDEYGNKWHWECTTNPTHWMPLPEPPEVR